MYGRSRKILALLVGTFTAAIIGSCVSVVFDLKTETGRELSHCKLRCDLKLVLASVSSLLFHGFPIMFCVPFGVRRVFYIFWIPLMCFETFLFILALFKGYLSYREAVTPHKWYGKQILDILVRDSVLYFSMYVP